MKTNGVRLDAWMPLYVGDWDGDTRHLNCEQDGAYGRLVRHYWRNGPLADEDVQLAQIVGMPLKRWKSTRPLIAAFFVVADGRWHHKRVDLELERWAERKRLFVERAAAGGKAKAAKSSASSTRKAVLEGCTSSSSPTGEPIEGSPRRGGDATRSPLDSGARVSPDERKKVGVQFLALAADLASKQLGNHARCGEGQDDPGPDGEPDQHAPDQFAVADELRRAC